MLVVPGGLHVQVQPAVPMLGTKGYYDILLVHGTQVWDTWK